MEWNLWNWLLFIKWQKSDEERKCFMRCELICLLTCLTTIIDFLTGIYLPAACKWLTRITYTELSIVVCRYFHNTAISNFLLKNRFSVNSSNITQPYTTLPSQTQHTQNNFFIFLMFPCWRSFAFLHSRVIYLHSFQFYLKIKKKHLQLEIRNSNQSK